MRIQNWIFWPALLFALTVSTGSGAEEELKGEGASGNWKVDFPGLKHVITLGELPPPGATPSVRNSAKIVPRPDGVKPAVPEGFSIDLYARDFVNPRHLLTAPNGDILVTESRANKIVLLRDSDGDGYPDIRQNFAEGLNQPFGTAFYPPGDNPQYLYVGNTDGVVRFPYHNGDLRVTGTAEKITDLSSGGRLTGGGHWTRDLVFSPDGKKLFVSIGSKTNVDQPPVPEEVERARIFVMNPDGSDKKTYAWGIRNAVGIAIQPQTGELWASVNERDGLGDDLVPDYVTSVREGGFYGWPWFYIGNHQDPRHPGEHPELAGKVIVPDVLVQSHSASLNMLFYDGSQFPEEFRNDAFAAFHGSWNREIPTGYKLIRIPLDHGKAKGEYEDFVTGFILPDGGIWGRPVGLTVMKDGSLLFSEDGNNTLWRVRYSDDKKARKTIESR